MEWLKELIENFDGEIYDLCYKLTVENEHIEEVFQYVCENLLKMPEEKSIVIEKQFTEEEIEWYKSIYGDNVNGILKSTIKKCDYGIISEADFYSSLWESFCANFTSEKEKAFAFYYTLVDSKIPYQYVGKPLSMDNEKFKRILDENNESVEKIKYIFKSNYIQRTEQASLILNCLEKIDDFEARTVLLARAFGLQDEKRKSVDIDDLIKKIDRKIAELEQEEEQESD